MKRWSVLLLLILALIFVTSCSRKQDTSTTVGAVLTDNQYKKFDRIVKENENFSIEWVDTQGYGSDGAFHLSGILQCKLKDCSGIDIAIISPEKLEAGSKAWYYKETNTSTINPKSYYCDSAKYGWYQNRKSVWCNATYSYQNNVTNQTVFYDVKTITQIGSPYAFITTAKNATVLWNTTTNTSAIVKTDITSKWNYKNRTTPYGDNIYYLQNLNLFKGKQYEFELVLKVDKSLLPLKYSVVVGDMATNKIYYVLDPTIVNARTWSTNDDFTNGTVLTNLTSSDSGITLTPASAGTDTFVAGDNFDDNSINTSYWVNSACSETGGEYVCDVDNEWTRSVDFSASPFLFNSSQNYNLSVKGRNPDAKRGCFMFMDDLPASSAESNCVGPNGIGPDDRHGFYLIGSQDVVSLPQSQRNKDVFSDTTSTFSFNFIHNSSGYITLKDGVYVNSTITNPTNPLKYWSFGDPQTDQVGGNLVMDDFKIQYLGTSVSAKTAGVYSDRQGWTPQTGNQITNITITADNSSGGNIRFRSNSTNASLDTSDWTVLTNGTQTLTLNLGVNNNIFYQYDFNGTGTGKVSSYTISEAVTNIVPVINNVRISPNSTVFSTDNLLGYCQATDTDDTTVNYYWQWFIGNTQSGTTGGPSNQTDAVEINLNNLSSATTTTGDNILFRCKADDGFTNSSYQNSSIEFIQGVLNGTVYDKNNQTVNTTFIRIINEVGNASIIDLYSNATGLFWTNISVASNYTLYAFKNSNVSAGGAIKTHVEVK